MDDFDRRLTSVVKDGACDLYRMVVKPGQPLLGKSHAAMYAACLYTSCRQEGTNRTFKEICGGAVGRAVYAHAHTHHN